VPRGRKEEGESRRAGGTGVAFPCFKGQRGEGAEQGLETGEKGGEGNIFLPGRKYQPTVTPRASFTKTVVCRCPYLFCQGGKEEKEGPVYLV